jgi:hypothetical protein
VTCWCDKPTFDWTHDFSPRSLTSSASGLSADLTLTPHFGVRVYELVGPYVELSLGGKATLPATQGKYEVEADLGAALGLDGPVFTESKVFTYSPPQFNTEFPLLRNVQFSRQALVGPPSYVGQSTLADGYVGQTFQEATQMTDGIQPYGGCTITATAPTTSASLAWLSASRQRSSCVLQGQPIQAGTFNFQLAAHDLVPGFLGEALTNLTLNVKTTIHNPTPSSRASSSPSLIGTYSAYVTSNSGPSGSSTTSVTPVNLNTGAQGGRIQIAGGGPAFIVIAPDTKTAYVTSTGTGASGNAELTLIPIDLNTATPETPILLKSPNQKTGSGLSVVGVAITPDGKIAWVSEIGAGDTGFVVKVDLVSRTAAAPIAIGANISGLVLTPDGSHAYMTSGNGFNGFVAPLDLGSGALGAHVQLPGVPSAIVMSPAGSSVYVISHNQLAGTNINQISVAGNTASKPVGMPFIDSNYSFGLAISPDGATLYALGVNGGAGNLNGVVVPVNMTSGTVGAPILLQSFPGVMVITPDGKTGYVVGDGYLTPIDLASNVARGGIAVGSPPFDLALVPA